MGQKVRPTGFRTGIMIDWQSTWYANKQDFSDLLVEDHKIREFVKNASMARAGIARIRIERTREKVVVYIHSARVGMIIGKKGQEVDKLTKELEDLAHRHIEVKTMEVNRPEVDPQLVAEDIAEQLEKRASFRRTMKRAIDQTMEAGPRAIRIQLSGRLGGAEMARSEKRRWQGSIPLSTLRAKVEYGFAEAKTAQGHIGIKVLDQQRGLPEPARRPTMPLMPKRVKFRKSQRGKVRGNASRGNTVSYGDFGLQVAGRRLAERRGDRGGPHHGDALDARRRPALHPRLSAQVGHGHPGRNPHGQGQGRAGVLGGGGQAGHDSVRDRAACRKRRPAIAWPAWLTRCRSGAGWSRGRMWVAERSAWRRTYESGRRSGGRDHENRRTTRHERRAD